MVVADGGKLQKTVHRVPVPVIIAKFKKVASQFCKAGSGSTMRKTAVSGSAKSEDGSMIRQPLIELWRKIPL